MICESLQSQLDNFTSNFFGPVTKSDVTPGVVNWSLPCGLDLGVPTDPRGVDEGVACYYLRVFRDKISTLVGPRGPAGIPGSNGHPGFTVSLSAFPQPSGPAPFFIRSLFNPVIKVGEIVFIDKSGWYNVLSIDEIGNLFVSLIQSMLGAHGVLDAGRVIIPTGPKGADLTGPKGLFGLTGDTGPAGEKGDIGTTGHAADLLPHGATSQSGQIVGHFPDFTLTPTTLHTVIFAADTRPGAAVPAPVEFTFVAPVTGKYLVRYTSAAYAVNSASLIMGLVNITDTGKNVSPDPAGLYRFLPGSYNNSLGQAFTTNVKLTFAASCIVTTSTNANTISLQTVGQGCRLLGESTTGEHVSTCLTWLRVT